MRSRHRLGLVRASQAFLHLHRLKVRVELRQAPSSRAPRQALVRIRSGDRGRVAALAAFFFGFGLAAPLSFSSQRRTGKTKRLGLGTESNHTVLKLARGLLPWRSMFGCRVVLSGSHAGPVHGHAFVVFRRHVVSPGCPTTSARFQKRLSLGAVSFYPVPKQTKLGIQRRHTAHSEFDCRVVSPGCQTVADRTAGRMPDRALEPDEKRRHSCFIDPGREVSRPMRISAGVDSRPNGGMLVFACESTRARLIRLAGELLVCPLGAQAFLLSLFRAGSLGFPSRPGGVSNRLVVKRIVAHPQPASGWLPCRNVRLSNHAFRQVHTNRVWLLRRFTRFPNS